MLVAEELTLLALDPESGRMRANPSAVEQALAGALLLDLAQAGPLSLDSDGVIQLVSTGPSHPVLGSGLSRLTGQIPLKVRDAIHVLAPGLSETVLDTMAVRGLVRRDEHRTLVLKILVRWHMTAPAMADAARADLTSILATSSGTPASASDPVLGPREAALLTVLGGADLLALAETSRNPASAARMREWCADVAYGRNCLHSVPDNVLAFQRAVHAALATSATASSHGAPPAPSAPETASV
ncbi:MULTISPECIES: GPP34 family phosphoprotein [Mumia]|uniref:GPP34 family phosphoprotein n=1 Tax=Mumia TaxID=1546255 RepID=UPI0014248083|nr:MULTISPECIES: GPP34 family phosphoprotein [unclassified Mumia]QMW66109.1 GPP34 family phosphoprotein [Mumia sp. ZJ1417]